MYWASAFFGKVENFYKIPEDLKIIYGDNYLMYKNLINHKINYAINNQIIYHISSSTNSQDKFYEIIKV